jgi:hypothetical protein
MIHNQKAPDGGPADFWVTMPVPARDAWYKPYDWSYQIKVPDGGLVETHDEYPFLAPGGGYAPSFEQAFKNVDPHHAGKFLNTYYLKCHNGNVYARVSIEWEPDSSPSASFRVSYVANPAGSRNLEPGQEHNAGWRTGTREPDGKFWRQ